MLDGSTPLKFKNGGASLEGLVVGLDWLDLDFFFHHFFEGAVPNFEFRPKMRISDPVLRRGPLGAP